MKRQIPPHRTPGNDLRAGARFWPLAGKGAKPAGARAFCMERRGFTLVEMLVSLIIGTIMVGGVMGLISVSMRHKAQLSDKSQIQPVLESAAQIILADPVRATEGIVQLKELTGAPSVAVAVAPVELQERRAGEPAGQLSRVMLSYRTGRLEFSVIIPPKRN